MVNSCRTRNRLSGFKTPRFERRLCLMLRGRFMDILAAVNQEEAKLQKQPDRIRGAIAALTGAHAPSVSLSGASASHGFASPKSAKGATVSWNVSAICRAFATFSACSCVLFPPET